MYWPSSMKIDQEYVISTANYVQRLKMYPHFDLAHYIIMICSVRDDLGPNSTLFFKTTSAKATAVWYLVFYSPFDLFYKITKLFPVKIILSILKEIQRTYKIHHGTAKGAGSGIIRVFEQLIRGTWSPQHHEILRPSFTTKACVIAAFIFTCDRHSLYINLPHEITYLGLSIFFVYFKLSSIIFQVTDPLAPLENLTSAIFMGGLWDALSRAISTSRERSAANKVENGSLPASVDKKEQ
ncbi:hypothetical protein M3Y94_01136600 [Aphelenchoides besseyi]|nr:hypothetical protein M3Y94_01136600 [Aphelenchoides besseyi]